MSPRLLMPLSVLALALLAGCSDDDDPTSPGTDGPRRLVAPLENAVVDVPLVADQPNTVLLTLQLPPDIPRVASAEIDIAATLDHVRIDGIPLHTLIARKLARLVGKADPIGATATLRVGNDPGTVCTSGILYGPFEVSHDTDLVVEPEAVAADDATIDVINMGTVVVCLTIVPSIDATLSVDALALDLAEGDCEAPADFAGTWTGTYQCSDWCGEPFGGPIQLVLTQDGDRAEHMDSLEGHFAGVICGDMYRFEDVGQGFTEVGTMTLTGPNTAIKRSTWRALAPPYCGGDCEDTLTRQAPGAFPAP